VKLSLAACVFYFYLRKGNNISLKYKIIEQLFFNKKKMFVKFFSQQWVPLIYKKMEREGV